MFLLVDAHDRDALDTGLAERDQAYVSGSRKRATTSRSGPPRTSRSTSSCSSASTSDRFRTDVEQAVARALSAERLPDGSLGFFHPDRFGFGQPLYLSSLYAAASAVPGVDSVAARRFSRYTDDDPPPCRPITAREPRRRA